MFGTFISLDEPSGDDRVYWRIQLDQDLLETIVNIYPEWFKDIYLSFTVMTDNDEQNLDQLGKMIIPLLQSRDTVSPPKAVVDEASLQQAMDKNKESLKVKLMTRRPINQLVEQGIMPSLKVPPHFHEQRQKLERAKMGDFLKNKIQKRPDRQELIQQHILEDTTVDPSLQDKQRQLKKARLTDELNDRLSHRPGPLELVKGNILHADEKFAQAVKEGQIQFKRTCEGQPLRHPPPSFLVEEDSGSDIALSPPQDILDQSIGSASSVDAIVPSPYRSQGSPSSQGDLQLTPTTPTNCVSPPTSSQSSTFSSHSESYHKENVPTVRNKKKPKPKSLPKARTIKFHEYKGPPNALKNQSSPSSSPSETSYELLLYQQQVFLQWQLELQHKYPQMILPVTQHPNGDQTQNLNSLQNGPIEHSQDSPVSSPQRSISKLEDMKVSDLKAELKKRNLPVSGSKPQLIERLKPYSDMALCALNNNTLTANVIDAVTPGTSDTSAVPISVGGIILDNLSTLTPKTEPVTSIVTMDTSTCSSSSSSSPPQVNEEPAALVVYNTVPVQGQLMTTSRPASVAPMDVENNSLSSEAMDCSDAATVINENIVKLQQKRIEELQRELQRSQMQLQQQQWLQQQQQALLAAQQQTVPLAPAAALVTTQQQQPTATAVATPTLQQANTLDTKALQRLQQHLQQKFQQQQLLQHLQQQQSGNANTIKFSPGSPAMSAAVKANLAAFIHNQHINSSARLANPPPTTLSQQSIPAFPGIQPIVLCQAGVFPNGGEKPRANSLPNGVGQQRTSSVPNFSTVITAKPVSESENSNTQYMPVKSPPNYHEATKQCAKNKQNNQEQKSQSGTTKQRSGRKSVKSQAVEDVLEILIKNGELPPSAAQEPPTPTTPETQKPSLAPPEFPTSSNAKASPSPVPSASNCLTVSGGTGLTTNSLLSSVLQDSDGVANPSLDFDFHLELQDIEAMDLGMLEHDPSEASNSSGVVLSNHQSGSTNQMASGTCDNDPGMSSTSVDMDIELSDWLDVLASAPSDNHLSSSTTAQPMYNCGGDPLLSNMANGQHDTFDLFSLEDMDFKTPTDLNILSWDKVDYAT